MPGEYASFAMRAVSLGRKRGRPPVLSSNAFYPFAAERRLASLLKAELARSVRESLASALGRLSDGGEDDGWTEGFLSGTDRAASEIVLNAREAFSRFSEMTVGTPYYPPDVEERVKDDWKAEFLACCRSADSDAKADIARALTEAKERGWNRAQAEAAVLERLDPKYAKRAELIARTETGKLNNAATMATYRSAGVEYYVWLATPDERTRPSHAALNGKICAVGDPDHWYEDNPDDPLRPVAHGRGKDMYHGDPGTDFQCRCTSIPWDPRIDSKYRVRKVPEPERKPTELETARAETEKARGEMEKTQKALENTARAEKETRRRLEIVRKANERHAEREDSVIEKIREEWRKRRAKNAHILPQKDITTINGVQATIDAYIKKFPNETEYSRINVTAFRNAPSGNGFTLMWANRHTQEIGFNSYRRKIFGGGYIPSPMDNLKNAMNKIRSGTLMSFDEEYALESFYHEINHSKAKKYVDLRPHGQGDYKRTAMEAINQFVSRHQYAGFVRRMGGEPSHQNEILSQGKGYARWVGNLRGFIKERGLSEKKSFEYFRRHLFNDPYDVLDDLLFEFFRKNSGTKKDKAAVLAAFEKMDKESFLQFVSSNSPRT